jgi:RNA polymerase sigma-70 factor (ECF subfamily)
LQRAQDLLRLRQAILSLPTNYREVVVLCEMEELDYEETARRLHCAVGTVRSRLHRARAILLAKMRRQTSNASREARCSV